jgi:hypothetical protein
MVASTSKSGEEVGSSVPASRDFDEIERSTKMGNIIERDELTRHPRTDSERESLIADAAYRIAARRGFSAGHELDDWLEAERKIDDGG